MKQNLVEFVSFTDEAHLPRQKLWNKYKSVLQRRQQSRVRGQRNFRCSRALFEKQVHVLDRRFDPAHALYTPDRAALEGGEEDRDEGAIVAAPPRGVDAAGLDEDSTLARDYFDAALSLFACVSVPAKSGSVVPRIVFQVLAKSAKPILVKSIVTKPRHKTSWCLQLLVLREGAELQAGQMLSELSGLSRCRRRPRRCVGLHHQGRCMARADAEGTTHLTSPSRAVPPHALADLLVPILALRDALR